MGSVLIIAEKPSQAQTIAHALLSEPVDHGPFWAGQLPDGRVGQVTALNGRVVDQLEPQEYHPRWGKPWRLEVLPFAPPSGIWKFRETQPAVLRKVHQLWRSADEIVNACDAGRQGEFIFWSAMRQLGWTPKAKPGSRLWITDPSPGGILAAWNGRRRVDDKKYLRLLNAAYAQWKADYLFGVNLSRYVTLTLPAYGSLGHPTYSIGRVKTPTLNLVQSRIKDIEDFVSEHFYRMTCEFYSERGNYMATVLAPESMRFRFDDRRFRDYDDMRGIKVAIASSAKEWDVFDGEEAVLEAPPPPFSTLELLRVSWRKFGWPAKRTMRVAQELYARDGAISYPRTESDAIPPGLRASCERTFAALWKHFAETEYPKLTEVGGMPVHDLYFPKEGITSDHHAVIPTGVIPQRKDERGITRDAYLLWDLIARRFLTALSPSAEIRACKRILELTLPEKNLTVRALLTAAPVKVPNWLLVEDAVGNSGSLRDSYADRLDITFPTTASKARMVQPHDHLGNTTPNDYYTEDTLLLAMHELRLGTAATRADHIEEIIADGYLERRANGHLFTTGLGAYHLEMMQRGGAGAALEAERAALWEEYFDKLELGQKKLADVDEFCDGVVRQVEQFGRALRALPRREVCTLCPDTFRVVERVETPDGPGFAFYGKYKNLHFPEVLHGRRMTAGEWRQVILAGRSGYGPFRLTSKKTGAPFVAKIRLLLKQRRFDFVFKRGGFDEADVIRGQDEEPPRSAA